MLLKSDGCASSLSSPQPGCLLSDYCLERGVPYEERDVPVPLETFVEYGLSFQRRLVPQLEQAAVDHITHTGRDYRVDLSTGETVSARRVVMAVGITHFARMPENFSNVGSGRVTHSSAHREFEEFAGRDVTVIGAGSSAVDVAVELAKAGAHSRLVTRGPAVRFSAKPDGGPQTRRGRLRHPMSGLGPGWGSRLSCDVPGLFRFAPGKIRGEVVHRHLGPSSPWHLRDAFNSTVEVVTARRVGAVQEERAGAIRIELLSNEADPPVSVKTDHVICATGYRADLSRLTMLDPELRAAIRTANAAPALDGSFQCSAPGLYFVGNAAAMTFGPLMRFVFGASFAASRLVSRVGRSRD
jgi:cation diffusion facilitator CzcD-associated flavoprotein CzcO